jgi:NADH:ubiquinone oxidoreductase subunit 4 (subunit M)
MNAVSVFRLFARLFLGKRRTGFTVMADALPRERWILAAGAVFVVLGGLFPNAIVARRAAEAETVEQAICVPVRPRNSPIEARIDSTVSRLPRCSGDRSSCSEE